MDTTDKVRYILSNIPYSDASHPLVVVGGQALYLWALVYNFFDQDFVDNAQAASITSDDVDLYPCYRDRESVRQCVHECAVLWSGIEYYPSIFESTPNWAVVSVSLDNDPYQVDFMESIKGLLDRDVASFCGEINYAGNRLFLLSPPLCMVSRVANAIGLGYGEPKIQRELDRINAGIWLTRRYLVDKLNQSFSDNTRPDFVLKLIRYLRKRFFHNDFIQVARQYNVDFTCSIPWDHPGWPDQTRKNEFPRLLRRFGEKHGVGY